MARVAVVGVGAIGGAIAGLLETAGGHEITLCTRRPLNTLSVETPEGLVRVTARNATDPAQAQPVDWVLVATKAYDAAATAGWFPALCAGGAPVAVLQNGVEHRERFEPYVPAERLLPIVIDCPAERLSDQTVLVRGAALMKVEDTPLGRSFAQLFQRARVKVELTGDFTTALWWKLCFNSVGALSALALKPSGVLRGQAMARVALEMVAECAAVGRAEGARLDESIGEEVLAMYKMHPADSVNSLLADRLAGRKMEWNARNGAIVRKGARHGIETPLNRMAAALLEAVEGEPV
ncbi:MAG: 2-dehydropantoate 2-reductase [Terracidiphilus sp.]